MEVHYNVRGAFCNQAGKTQLANRIGSVTCQKCIQKWIRDMQPTDKAISMQKATNQRHINMVLQFREISYEDAKKEVIGYLLSKEPPFDAVDVGDALKIHYSIISDILHELSEKGLIESE